MPAAPTIYDEKQKVTIAGIKKNAFYVVKHENARVKYPLRHRPFKKDGAFNTKLFYLMSGAEPCTLCSRH